MVNLWDIHRKEITTHIQQIKDLQTQRYKGIVQGHMANFIPGFKKVGINSQVLTLFQ